MNSVPKSLRGSSTRLGLVATGLTLVTLALVVGWGRWQLGQQMRSQIMGRDAVILQAMASRTAAEMAGEDPNFDLGEQLDQYALLVNLAYLTNIIAARLFGPDGEFFYGEPFEVKEAGLSDATLAQMRRGEPVTRYRPSAPRQELFLSLPDLDGGGTDTLSWLEIYLPLCRPDDPEMVGVAQIMVEAVTLEREFARLDRRLNEQSVGVFLVGALVATMGLGWVFRRMGRAQALLAARTEDLRRANQELAQAAKVTAVGAVAAHLIHSLKNPVAGLQSFVGARQDTAAGPESEEWREALGATRRMQALIQQVVGVLRDQQQEAAYTLSLAELTGLVVGECQAAAAARGVRVETAGGGELDFDNRVAGLLRLLLVNLVQNAVEASPEGAVVGLRWSVESERVVIEVRDQGAGVPSAVQARLFEPVRSTREGGSGIGLAISRQLAVHLGAELSLVSTSETGTVFRVSVPRTAE
ncbi:MAG: HAMP domain-containing histidine kinase [Verrucomicrobiales bacterium]|nr:HAMP domain-containing histidine kinase [Verrucomicrobiales bacterium]